MKNSILLIISIACAITLSSYQSPTVTSQATTSEELSNNSINIQTETTGKDEFCDQTGTVNK